MKKNLIALFIVFAFTGQPILVGSDLDFRFSRNQDPRIENFSSVAELFYLDQLNGSWRDASKFVYGHTDDPLNQRYYPWVEISAKYGASKIDLLRIIPFKSGDGSIEGYLAFVRYLHEKDQFVKEYERFFVDAWFEFDGGWVVSPSTLFLMDGTFSPVSAASAYASFISAKALDEKIRVFKAEYGRDTMLESSVSPEEQIILNLSRGRVADGE